MFSRSRDNHDTAQYDFTDLDRRVGGVDEIRETCKRGVTNCAST